MRNSKFILSATFGVLLSFGINAQQMPQSNLYTTNLYNINPAYAGYNGSCIEGYISHLSQWVGVTGSPVTNYLNIHSGLGKNFGIGADIILDNTDMVNRFSGNMSIAYRAKFSEDQNLRFGVSAGIYQVNINPSSAVVFDPTDEVILGGTQSGAAFNSEFGLIYNYKKFIVGVSIPQVMETKAEYGTSVADLNFRLSRHFVGYMGYDWTIADNWSLQPSAMYKTITNGLDQFDINVQGTYKEMVSLGLGYRTHVGMLARLNLNIKDLFVLGYAYELPGANITSYSRGSHEVLLGLKFCRDADKPAPKSFTSTTPSPAPEPDTDKVEEPATPEVIIEPEVEKEEPETTEEPAITEETISDSEKKAFDINIQFPVNDAKLNDDFYSKLDKVADILSKYPNLKIEVLGHSCDLGKSDAKQKVSETRANAVKAYLVKKGVAGERIKAKGVSDSMPALPNASEANREKNRRVEFKLVE